MLARRKLRQSSIIRYIRIIILYVLYVLFWRFTHIIIY